MKFAVSTYSFGKYNKKDSLGIFGIVEKTAEMGFDGIEFAEDEWIWGCNPDTAKKLNETCAEKGLEKISLCVGADFVNGSRGDLKEEIAGVCRLIDYAALLGVGKVRHDVCYGLPADRKSGMSYEALIPRIAEGCREVTKYAEQKGIETMTENHGFFSQDSERVERLINAVDHPNFGVLIDVGNFLFVDEDPCTATGRLAPYAKHVHAKDFHVKAGAETDPGTGWIVTRGGNFVRPAIIGHGDASVLQSLRILKNNGYDGYLSVEFEGLEDNILGIDMGLCNLRRYVQML